MISFKHATAYLTVATILDRDLPLVAEQALLKRLLNNQGGQPVRWEAGRPSDRWGLHPDVLFRTGLTGALDEWCAQELFLQANLSNGDTEDQLLSIIPSKRIDDIRMELNAIYAILNHHLKHTTCQLLVRVQPSGISTLTLKLCLSHGSLIDDTLIFNLLKCFDPRRGFPPSTLPCPDLSRLHTSLLETIRIERLAALKSTKDQIDSEVREYTKPGSTYAGLLPHAKNELELLDILHNAYEDGYSVVDAFSC